ncbi:2OG-Fe(II) oxygenase superfamily [Synechococcus phage syn9]|uniref:2OG-Fe(II) oxygenase superfamily n=1 Tax=Synechococcus phage syn9 TaxID=382359 RepID=Q0QZ49_BPSYS|nr:2OG-Fe(II) oxygenase [Synechococcus phage syn9]ABA47147.1 2OG-Fe(II) oxygenase superfamily [Synechococcus phage syn9]AGH56502.1 hypothetical protein CPUG_00008 [Cyanophage Syn10]
MATNLENYIRIWDDVISEDLCKEIIEKFERDPARHNKVNREQRPQFIDYNISDRYEYKDPDWVQIQLDIQEVFIDYAEKYIDALDVGPDFPARYCFEQYRIKKYSLATDCYKDHVDVQDYNSARRFLVGFIYLNTPYQGGETRFPKLDLDIKPVTGRMLMFPANWMYRHSGQPVVGSPKYLLGTYLQYL